MVETILVISGITVLNLIIKLMAIVFDHEIYSDWYFSEASFYLYFICHIFFLPVIDVEFCHFWHLSTLLYALFYYFETIITTVNIIKFELTSLK